jgi:cadmium resistance protein CadD (predicted permease)
MDFPAQVGAGIWAFVATNVDDLLFLMIFFANRRFPVSNCSLAIHWKGVAHRRQSLRFTHCFSVPSNLIGLVGLFPIAIGIKELLELCKNNENDKDDEELHR